jgi:ribonuclease D
LEKLKNWRKIVAKETGVESDIVLPKAYLARLADRPPRSMSELEILLGDSPSRFQNYGKQLLRILGG